MLGSWGQLRSAFTPQSFDDREHPVRILRAEGFRDWPNDNSDPRITRLIRRVRLDARSPWLAGWFAPIVIAQMVWVIAWFALFWLLYPLVTGWPPWLVIMLWAIAGFLPTPLLIPLWKNARSAVLTRLILSEGLCPSCGYNLHGVPADPDACVRCPECAAAWSTARIRRTAQFLGSGSGRFAFSDAPQGGDSAWTCRDARNDLLPLLSPLLKRTLANCPPTDPRRARLLDAKRAIARASLPSRAACISIVVLALAAFFIFIAAFGLRIPVYKVAIATVVIVSLVVYCGLSTNFGFSKRATMSELLARALCPSCATDLTLDPDTDRCSTCPECLAAWKLAPASQPADPTSPSPPPPSSPSVASAHQTPAAASAPRASTPSTDPPPGAAHTP